ncbi:reverse transcriptase domain-containing protein [Tanacetum coccineum]
MPRQGRRRVKPSITKMLERRAEVKWKIGKLKQVLSKIREKSLPFQNFEKCTRRVNFYGRRGSASIKEGDSAVLMTERESLGRANLLLSTGAKGPTRGRRSGRFRKGRRTAPGTVDLVHDSKLVANQVNGTYTAKETDMIKYLEKVKALASTFRAFSIKQVPRSKNKKADALSKMASTSFAHLSKQVLVEELKEKMVNESEVLAVVEEEGDSWMTPIHEYLTDETLPAERKKARAIKRKSQRFAIINGILYKKSFLGPWLRCVGPSQANYVLREIHEGSCSMHAGTRSVVAKALRIGYYWPTMHEDARALIRACQECQVHKPVPRNPQEKLNPITSPWPFYKWGIDIAGPFPEGPRKVNFLIVVVDYFTK